MVSKTIVVCDFDEHEADEDVRADEKRTFKAHGQEYEIDLCSSCDLKFQAFEQLMQRWINASHLVGAATAPAAAPERPRRRSPESSGRRSENTAVRAWARENGIDIGDRGRIPDSVRERYREDMTKRANGRWDEAAKPEEHRPSPVDLARPRPTQPTYEGPVAAHG